MTREEIEKIASDYLNNRESELDMLEVFAVAKEALEQKPKTGNWIEEKNDYGEVTAWHCDNCYEDSGFFTTCAWDFCPNCGAKMIEQKESEV